MKSQSTSDPPKSPQDALEMLKEGPDFYEISRILKFLHGTHKDSFSLTAPSVLAAQIIQVLICQTIPDFWGQLNEDKSAVEPKQLIFDALTTLSGLGAILARLKLLTASCKNKTKLGNSTGPAEQIRILIEILEAILIGPSIVSKVYEDQFAGPSITSTSTTAATRRTVGWKEFVSLIASSRVIAIVAEAEDVLANAGGKSKGTWLARGNDYTRWLGENVAGMVYGSGDERRAAAAQICSKSLLLGYSDVLVEALIVQLPLNIKQENGGEPPMQTLRKLVQSLHAHEQRSLLASTLRILSRNYLSSSAASWDLSVLGSTPKGVTGSAALIRDLISGHEPLSEALVEHLNKPEASPLTGSAGLRRAVLAALSSDEDRMQDVAEKLMRRFGDQLFIKHAPIVQQEATAQLLLLACGYVHRKQRMFLFTIAKSSSQMHGVSNRLKATSPRARWLGMIVGMAISELTDKNENQLRFVNDSMDTPEANWYRALVHVEDKVGSLNDLRKFKSEAIATGSTKKKSVTSTSKVTSRPRREVSMPKAGVPSGIRIIELDSDDGEDLVRYAKPDSDPEDEDEDPTLIERNKPKAPVYIRDLITGLRDNENYDRHLLALETAASLIRRKANFGKEVSDHVEELATIIMGLNDQFEIENFLDLRQEALIAILIAQPKDIAQYLARSCFEGDFSLQQRTTMLIALGLGARELAGFKEEDRPEVPSFPTKQLPEHLQKIYAETSGQSVNKVVAQLETSMVGPLALHAADQLSGPNALKIRTFSSRIAVEKARQKPITNELAKIVAENFFFPLTGRWWSQIQAYGNQSIAFSTHLLPTYLRTLALLLHASGPSTLSLPQMTSELWDLLLSLRSSALNENDTGILESLLFTLLTLLDVNQDKSRLASDHGKELVETQEWARMVLERRQAGSGSGDEEGERVRMLAAAVVVRCSEVVEKWQRLMLGEMVDL